MQDLAERQGVLFRPFVDTKFPTLTLNSADGPVLTTTFEYVLRTMIFPPRTLSLAIPCQPKEIHPSFEY